jgi:uncharacterized protein (TIGR03437 family)
MFTSISGSPPSTLQWTFTYPAANVIAISATTGAASTAASKAVQCWGAGTYTCVASGANGASFSNGMVAVVNLTMAAGLTTTAIGITNAFAALPLGYSAGLSTSGGVVTGGAWPTVSSLSCTQAILGNSGSSTCTVRLSASAPAGGASVSLSNSNATLSAPTSVTVAAGATSATFNVTTGTLSGGSTATITATYNSSSAAPVSIQLSPTASSPLSSNPPSIGLTYISHGVANQTSASAASTISDNHTAGDTYTILSSSVPSWLSVTAAHGNASLTATDTLTFQVVQAPANALSGNQTAAVHLQVANYPDLTIAVNLTLIAQQPLTTATSTPLTFGYTLGSATTPSAQNASIAVASGTMAFNLDSSTVPAWLTATASGIANSAGAAVTFTPVAAAVAKLAAGSYSASVGYQALGAGSELLLPVVLTVSASTATISLKGNAANFAILNYPGATTPTPVVTVVSSDNTVEFSAACAVTSTYSAYVPSAAPCVMSGASSAAASVTGSAGAAGTALTTTFDPALFAGGTPYGTVVTETVTVTAGSQTLNQSYAYEIQPAAPTFTALSPTSTAQIDSGDSLVVTLTGTNFVGPGSILPGSSVSPTRVFAGTSDVTADAVVLTGTTILVSIPQADFPQYAAGKTTAGMAIGVANQTGGAAPTAATATRTLVVTNAPVVYAVASTATYMQPAPGTLPKVAPFELISIFGANFGVSDSVTGAVNSFNQLPTSVAISGAGTPASPYVNLSVTFKIGSSTYKAPILFANATEINCLVPSAMTVGQTASLTITSGSNSSDGLFDVSVVAAQPGIFALSADGVGPAAILNLPSYTVNSSSNPASAGDIVSIYATGLGVPNSIAVDNTANNSGAYSTACVAISDTTAGSPGYLQVLNTTTATYTAPAARFANIDGVLIEPQFLNGGLPPCLVNSGSTAVTVTFGSTVVSGNSIGYAGFVTGAVAGLYQINVPVPAGLTGGNVPVTISVGGQSSPAGLVYVVVQ